MVHLSSSKAVNKAEETKANEKYRKCLPAEPIFAMCIDLSKLASSGLIKQQLLVSSFALALRLILDQDCFQKD